MRVVYLARIDGILVAYAILYPPKHQVLDMVNLLWIHVEPKLWLHKGLRSPLLLYFKLLLLCILCWYYTYPCCISYDIYLALNEERLNYTLKINKLFKRTFYGNNSLRIGAT